jgi:hypothetical protein
VLVVVVQVLLVLQAMYQVVLAALEQHQALLEPQLLMLEAVAVIAALAGLAAAVLVEAPQQQERQI